MTRTPRRPLVRRAAAVAASLLLLTACGAADTAETTDPASVPSEVPLASPSTGVGTETPAPSAAPSTAVAASPSVAAAPTPASTGSPDDGITIAAAPVSVDARAYGVFDLSSNRWLAGDGIDTPLAVGSIMKLLTALVVMQVGDPTRMVTVPDLQIDPMESAIGLVPGQDLPRDVLLRAMLIVSANDAARVLARDIGGDEANFVAMMNAAAQQLGLTNTLAANPTGLDEGGARSTVRDVVRLSSVLMQDEAFRTTVARTFARMHGTEIPASNDLLTMYQGADGIKTGTTTDAGHCLAASATRDGRQIVVVVLGSSSDESRVTAASALLDWAFAQPMG
jgi:D-alanyl-D-alanine carboxypeptidase (penicillin-binding protein 5/6)